MLSSVLVHKRGRAYCHTRQLSNPSHNGGLGYSRHKPFEHIYRHHRCYRIIEGAEEIQLRRIGGYMFGYMQQQAPKGMMDA